MKKSLAMALAAAAVLTLILSAAYPGQKGEAGHVAREYPIAAGVWYPHQGEIPDRPMRYYRARCWPGCHTGSSYGLHQEPLMGDEPIFPTSTIDLKSD